MNNIDILGANRTYRGVFGSISGLAERIDAEVWDCVDW
jgi:hypothetical protein